ncbi:NAD-dependent epimerase/dehydratase family protein [Streptomyces celluloflavus]|uniref:NAD-dependent epimerase/dehydratase family protein n=1 Tax=Streptomyces celluloflavus TaxID=58344 RepID=A0ABW7RP91_9ACTN
MRLLVIGAGMVGAHVVRAAAESGWEVAALDRSPAALEHVRPWASAGTLHVDIADRTALNDAIHRFSPDTVVHTASRIPAEDTASATEASAQVRAYAQATASVAHATASAEVRRVVLTSSLAVYDLRSTSGPLTETLPPRPRSVYGRGKHAEELVAVRLLGSTSTSLAVLRLVGTYGPGRGGGKLHRSLRRLCEEARLATAAGRPVHVPEDFHGREYLHASDAARAVLSASDPRQPDGVFNIATGHVITASDLAAALTSAGYPATASFTGGAATCPLLDTARSERLLGFRARIGLADGIADLLSTPRSDTLAGPAEDGGKNNERLMP